MHRKIGLKGIRPRAVQIVNDEGGDTKVHQGKGDSAPGTASPDLYDRCTLRAATSQALRKALAPPAAISVVSSGATIRRNRDGVNGTNLGSFRVYGVK